MVIHWLNNYEFTYTSLPSKLSTVVCYYLPLEAVMTWFFFALIFVLTSAVILGADHLKSWDNDGRLPMDGNGLDDIEKFHLISRWGAHH